MNGVSCLEVTSLPSPTDYDEPKTAFLILARRLAFEGYTYNGVRRGLADALYEFTNKHEGLEWRGLFEELGDGAAFLDMDEYYETGDFE